jgi:uncharacterized delta-60 repeat protein
VSLFWKLQMPDPQTAGTYSGTNTLVAAADDQCVNPYFMVTTPIGSDYDSAYSVTLQGDGKIVAAGYSQDGLGNSLTALVRYSATGALDSTFNSAGPTPGTVTADVGGSGQSGANAIIMQGNKFLAAGYASDGSSYLFALARFNDDGTLDDNPITGFGPTHSGFVTTNVGGNGESGASSVALDGDGKIVTAGYSYNGVGYDLALARYSADGVLDTTFNSGGTLPGTVSTHIGSGTNDSINSVAIQSDGKIVVAGTSYDVSDNYSFILARYSDTGALDSTFNSAGPTPGTVTMDVGGGGYSQAKDIAIQSDGKIVAVGWSYDGIHNNFGLIRYMANGTLDTDPSTGFGPIDGAGPNRTGIVTTDVAGHGNSNADTVALDEDGNIVAAGSGSDGSTNRFALARYDTNGSLDTTGFGSPNGYVTTDIRGVYDHVRAIAIQPDGKIVAVGHSDNGANYDFALVRYTTAGEVDVR